MSSFDTRYANLSVSLGNPSPKNDEIKRSGDMALASGSQLLELDKVERVGSEPAGSVSPDRRRQYEEAV